MPSLFVYQGQDQGALFEVEEGSQGIGRDAANPVQVHDNEVSRKHAEIEYDGTVCRISSLPGSTGTFVNEVRVDRPQPLMSGDRVRVGATIFLFTDPEAGSTPWPEPWIERFGHH